MASKRRVGRSPVSYDSPRKKLRSSSVCTAISGDEGHNTLNDPSSYGLNAVKVYIVHAKLPPDVIQELTDLVETYETPEDSDFSLKLCSEAEDADVIVTAVRMRKRLERHVPWELAKQKAIVTPDWLRQSFKENQFAPCRDYAAIRELEDTTESNCPDASPSCAPEYTNGIEEPENYVSDLPVDSYMVRYACMRNSPLVCPNQDLVSQLDILRLDRELEGLSVRSLSYERAIAAIKAYPHKITGSNMTEVAKVPYIGEKVLSKIKEFVRTGEISECTTISSSERFRSLSAFTTIYGIGPATARQLYSRELRTIEDLERHYDVPVCPDDIEGLEPGSKIIKRGKFPELSIKAGIALRHDLAKKIPRKEVEEIQRVVMEEVGRTQKGFVSTITGGYRRGKPESNDVDIVISHSDFKQGGQVKGLSQDIVRRLYDQGLVTHVMHIAGFHERNVLRTAQWDSLEKALTVFRLPGENSTRRRVDLIFAAPEVYWTAVVGWTGSRMFERDLRIFAQDRGMKFDSCGITRRYDSKQYYPKSEKEVFDLLGLPFIHPTMRNADA